MKWVNRLYIFFLGIILSITTGFGIAAFYPQPVAPSYPNSPFPADKTPTSCFSTPQAQETPECQKALDEQRLVIVQQRAEQQKFDEYMKIYENKNSSYTRTAIFFGIFVGALFAILGIGLIKKSRLIATGFLLASVLTAIFTRVLINLASLGSSVSGTGQADFIAYAEFTALLVLSIAVVFVGLKNLSDNLAAGTAGTNS